MSIITPGYVTCPYNSSHEVKISRLQYHLAKCRATSGVRLTICPYNAQHHIKPELFAEHLERCADRRIVDRTRYPVTKQTLVTGNLSQPSYHHPDIPAPPHYENPGYPNDERPIDPRLPQDDSESMATLEFKVNKMLTSQHLNDQYEVVSEEGPIDETGDYDDIDSTEYDKHAMEDSHTGKSYYKEQSYSEAEECYRSTIQGISDQSRYERARGFRRDDMNSSELDKKDMADCEYDTTYQQQPYLKVQEYYPSTMMGVNDETHRTRPTGRGAMLARLRELLVAKQHGFPG